MAAFVALQQVVRRGVTTSALRPLSATSPDHSYQLRGHSRTDWPFRRRWSDIAVSTTTRRRRQRLATAGRCPFPRDAGTDKRDRSGAEAGVQNPSARRPGHGRISNDLSAAASAASTRNLLSSRRRSAVTRVLGLRCPAVSGGLIRV